MSIEAMKQALEILKADSMTDEQYGKTITDLEQAIATEEFSGTQEPVAYQDTAKHDELVSAEDWENISPKWHWMYRPLYTHPQPKAEKQEPVALPCCGYDNPEAVKWNPHNQVFQCHNCGQVYTPQRQPQYDKTEMNAFVQNLYDQKMREGKHGHYETMFHVVHKAIERAAHGIKEKNT
jgi:hypothetical protein